MVGLSTLLNAASTLALIGALVFTGIQVRTTNRIRAEQNALAVIHAIQTAEWTRTLIILNRIPAGMNAAQIEALGSDVVQAIEEYGVRLETVGYMVFRGFIAMETVDQLFGGITLLLWSRIKPWMHADRERKGNPRMYEWVEWLADRLTTRRKRADVTPAFIAYADWKQAHARTTY